MTLNDGPRKVKYFRRVSVITLITVWHGTDKFGRNSSLRHMWRSSVFIGVSHAPIQASPKKIRDPYLRTFGWHSNQILHDDQSRREKNQYTLDHACGQRFLWHEFWRVIHNITTLLMYSSHKAGLQTNRRKQNTNLEKVQSKCNAIIEYHYPLSR